jgi:hypothetical protein
MTSRDFCFWLQGYFEINPKDSDAGMTCDQVDIVRKHLALVFKHEIDPSAGPPEHQHALDAIHAMTTPTTAGTQPEPQFGGHAPGRPGVLYRC